VRFLVGGLRTRILLFSAKNMLVAYLVGGNILELQRFFDFGSFKENDPWHHWFIDFRVLGLEPLYSGM